MEVGKREKKNEEKMNAIFVYKTKGRKRNDEKEEKKQYCVQKREIYFQFYFCTYIYKYINIY